MSVVNCEASTQAIWITLTNLIKNIAGFVVFLFLISSLDVWCVGTVLVTLINI